MSDYAASCRLRTGRYSCLGQTYLVTSNTRNRTPIFRDFTAGRLLVRELRRAEEQGFANSLAWVVMPDHLHWLFELKAGTLDGLIQRVKACSSRTINRHRSITEPVWQSGYHDKALRAEDDLVKLARYTVNNPVRAGLVRRVGDYSLWDAIWV
ncbi:transposase [Xanthomonas sp. WHRI 1810A]|uniref:REP-associated tyrosine transposase n=1 Tax=Xanthomonas sp. WHRI 1810A TaxID=3161565 RepID=UPI0032E8554B